MSTIVSIINGRPVVNIHGHYEAYRRGKCRCEDCTATARAYWQTVESRSSENRKARETVGKLIDRYKLPTLPTGPRPDWRHHAKCRGLSPEMFYVDRGDQVGFLRAVSICLGTDDNEPCPVIAECADAGKDEHHGVWGGGGGSLNRRRRIPINIGAAQ